MRKLPAPLFSAVLAWAGLAARAEALVLDGALHPVIWEDAYKLGLGLSGGARARLASGLETGAEIMATHFRVRVDIQGREPVTELGLRTYAVYPIRLEAPFLLKLGGYIGYHKMESDHSYLSVGGEAQAAFDLPAPFGLYLQFSPGYLVGANSQGIFRLGLGLTYALGQSAAGVKTKAPKKVEETSPAAGESPAMDFGSTMVPLPEPEPTSPPPSGEKP